MQADLITKVILPLSLVFIMFGMGLSLKAADFKSVFRSPKAMLVGIFGQMLLLPLAAFVLAIAFSLPAELAVGLMIIALAPGGATSNMYSYLFKGDLALSISLTAVVGLITPFTIPFVIYLSMRYFMGEGQGFELPILKTIIQLLAISVVPVIFGMIVLAKWPQFSSKVEGILKWFSVSVMFTIIGLLVFKNSDNMLSFFIDAGLATLALNLSALLVGFILSKSAGLNQKQAITIGFEIGIQNGTLAMVVAGTLIGNSTMMIPALTYGLFMFITGGLFGWLVTVRHQTSLLQS